MKAVWKFPLRVASLQKISMPKNSTLLTVQMEVVQMRGQHLCLWALIDSDKEVEDRFIAIADTGAQVPENTIRYIGTFQIPEREFVGHVFEVKGE